MAHLHFTINLRNRGIYWTHVFPSWLQLLLLLASIWDIVLTISEHKRFMTEAINSISWGIKFKIYIGDQITIINCIIDYLKWKDMMLKKKNAMFIMFPSYAKMDFKRYQITEIFKINFKYLFLAIEAWNELQKK